MRTHHLLSMVPCLPEAIVKSSRMNLGGISMARNPSAVGDEISGAGQAGRKDSA